jgi:hypothetical protein
MADEYEPWPYEPRPLLSREPAGFWEEWPFEDPPPFERWPGGPPPAAAWEWRKPAD